jgi:lincosamide and streptogramin A transport system ATP-binding/permease protein
LKLVCGEDLAHTGEVKLGGGVTISYVPQDTSFLAGSLADFASDHGLDESLFKAILRKMDFSRSLFDRDMRSYSPGQKKKVLLAASLSCRAHLYIWDEPLNFIDIFSRMQLEELLLNCPFPMLFVEHDAALTDAVATKKIFL